MQLLDLFDLVMMSQNYSNIEFGIRNDVERYTLAVYVFFVFFSSLIGDTLILFASFHKNAFKVNKMIVVFIQHIAVSDLASVFSYGLPNAISLITNSWVLGDGVCYLGPYIAYMVFPTGMFLIVALTTSKFLLLRYPLRAANWSHMRAHLVCGLIWLFSLIYPLRYLIVDRTDVYFDYRVYNCEYGFTAEIWGKELKIPMAILGFISYLLPNIIIVITTIPTLKYLIEARTSAKRVQGSVPWQGAMTVALTSAVFCVATIPFAIYATGSPFTKATPTRNFDVHLFRISYFLTQLNLMSNFYIYTLTIRSFRRFFLTKFFCVSSANSQCSVRHNRSTIFSSAGKVLLFFYFYPLCSSGNTVSHCR